MAGTLRESSSFARFDTPLDDRWRRKLKFHFMNPWQKWKAKRKFPFKMILQFVKVVLVTVQVSSTPLTFPKVLDEIALRQTIRMLTALL